MIFKQQDSTNSKREWGVGGQGFENTFGLVASNDTLHVGFSDTYSYFIASNESGWGHLGVGLNPSTTIQQKWYNTIVADGVVEKGTKFNFTGSTPVTVIDNPYGRPYTFSIVTTPTGTLLRTQYYESHLITGSVSFVNNESRIYFTEFPRRDGIFFVPNCEARTYRLLASTNGIQRISLTQSRSFSAYWDVVFGIKNFEYCPFGSAMAFIGSSNLTQVNRSSFISTGTINITASTAPQLNIDILTDGKFQIGIYISGTYNVVGSAKLTTVDCASLYNTSDYVAPPTDTTTTTTTSTSTSTTSTTTSPPVLPGE